ncbi:efflux RND transporter periplasmic adaptor subunit [Leptothoe kymatousa TAU-MAC 1615]|uniref:Efflux RND transporter periplasmic adaptor subunit n=2 Tax=Leptothoe TaxID=2651725 RepID=A0ABS5Y367_9CYAN|nr:efflux RND transporter periplasmic adaptor subunit [Leptothoe kymatousa TAU-MAC 1615]
MGIWDLRRRYDIALITGLGIVCHGCTLFPAGEAQVQRPGGGQENKQPIAVEVARATLGNVQDALAYTGTTQPAQQITLRAQTAGTVVATPLDTGDRVQPGTVMAQIDSGVLTARVNEAQAELSVRQSEVATDQVSITDAQTAAVQAKATRDQAKLDADRLRRLADRGAISHQAAEAAELTLINAEQAVEATEAQIEARQQAIAAAASRVTAQQAVLAEAQEQLQWVTVTAPMDATVLSRAVDPGDFVQPGTALFEVGNLDTLTIAVQVSELEIENLSLGQPATIQLDAFPNITATGSITRISPVADTTSRLIPVEVTLTNPDPRIGSGLLARVRFNATADPTVVVPLNALNNGSQENTIFVLAPDADPPTVTARSVTTGNTHQGNIEILSGLAPKETFVISSDRTLETGQAVRLSILSEVAPQ